MFYSTRRIYAAWWCIRWKRVFHTCVTFDKKEQNHQQQQTTERSSKKSCSGRGKKTQCTCGKKIFLICKTYVYSPYRLYSRAIFMFRYFTKIYHFFCHHLAYFSYFVFSIHILSSSPFSLLALMCRIGIGMSIQLCKEFSATSARDALFVWQI